MSRLKAVVYRDARTAEGTAEAVAALLESCPQHFTTSFIGPDEDLDITPSNLKDVTIYAQPGGPDLDDAWEVLHPYAETIRSFVRSGGKYLGICLGAYLAGHTPGFGLLPENADADSEIEQRGAQVTDDADTIIEIDWKWHKTSGRESSRRWVYFQEGAMIEGLRAGDNVEILGTYSSTGHVAAAVCNYGAGRVAVCGPHPEANQDWYDEYDLVSPDGLQTDIGIDLVDALMAEL